MRRQLFIALLLAATPFIACAQLAVRHIPEPDDFFEKPDPASPRWTNAPVAMVTMMPQMIATPSKMTVSTAILEARALHNGRWLAVAVRWADEQDDRLVNKDLNSDAVAIAFPVGEPGTTSPFMGGPGTPVEINHWKAVWQRDVEQGYADITDTHPNTAVVKYHGRTNTYDNDIKALAADPEASLAMPAIRLGNPVSQVNRVHPVEQLAAAGFTGTLTTQKKQDARASGRYADGHWTVVLARPLDSGDPQDRVLKPGVAHEINFAVWDGGEHDVGAKKSYSMLMPLTLDPLP